MPVTAGCLSAVRRRTSGNRTQRLNFICDEWAPVAASAPTSCRFSVILLRVLKHGLLFLAAMIGIAGLVAQEPAQAPAPQSAIGYQTIVLDPGHGGADVGARGGSGVLEKDVVRFITRAVASALERDGWRVVLTRQGDQLLSFDARAEIANAERNAIFLTLHVGSAGAVGTVRSYYFEGFPPEPSGDGQRGSSASANLLRWDRAQQPYLESSRRLAELLQVHISQRFRGSPDTPSAAAVRQLRNIAAPAVAIELSSVAVSDTRPLENIAPGLAEAIVRALATFRTLPAEGAR